MTLNAVSSQYTTFIDWDISSSRRVAVVEHELAAVYKFTLSFNFGGNSINVSLTWNKNK